MSSRLDPNLAHKIARAQLDGWKERIFSPDSLALGRRYRLRGITCHGQILEYEVEIIDNNIVTVMEDTAEFWSPCIKVRVIDRDQEMIMSIVDFLLHVVEEG